MEKACSSRYKAPEKGKTQSGSAPAERFAFHGWYAAGKGVSGQKPNTKKRRRLHLTEVTIQPNDHYCFEIWAGNQPVISFFFQKLPEAVTAAAELKALLPQIEATGRDLARRPASNLLSPD